MKTKYRAWDGKVMWTQHLEGMPALYALQKHLFDKKIFPIKWMQWTGLLDKQDVEIYEGDIVKDGKYIGQVKFKNGCFIIAFINTPKDWSDEYIPIYGKMLNDEVIGNIYENEDLLK